MVIAFLFIFLLIYSSANLAADSIVDLPEPRRTGKVSLEEAIFSRHGTRAFKDKPLRLQQISQLLWAAGGKGIDGLTGPSRAAPSAGGLYPLEFILVSGKVEGLEPGIYRYSWKNHKLRLLKKGDHRNALARAALNQRFIGGAPASIVIAAVYSRTALKYGQRGVVRYVHMDAGHASENMFLQAVALGIGTVTVGAFMDGEVKKVLSVDDEEPLYIMPFGWPRMP
jgi:SagB-type dehydrogenase family enzyme